MFLDHIMYRFNLVMIVMKNGYLWYIGCACDNKEKNIIIPLRVAGCMFRKPLEVEFSGNFSGTFSN